ncbi:2og-Fe oxygenase family protein [Niveomyces insectorum RCEF 264]|uniref:2og-Fe oxygenase family protein n=1 Tax=Niveomyces insectorum RCEF 264 TaxID=1081102 RepID=A0A162ME81_9HYPO|nr:2og-Fe oxygenase family protein [Niveomyces insectorum RCEF 264]
MSFTSIPVLDLSLADDPATKPAFLADLRNALIEVGFFYVKNVGVPDELYDRVIEQGRAFFDIPLEEKLKIEMKNAPSFLGYSRLSAEITAGAVDHREQIDLSTEHALPAPGAPRYENLLAPNQWPSPAVLPAFRPVFTDFLTRMGAVSMHFTTLVAEAIGLPPTAFARYFDPDPARQQHKLKVVKYPDESELGRTTKEEGNDDNDDNAGSQGVGPHKDSMYITFLLQASHHRGLQAQNTRGAWIDAPPVPGTLVVVIGQGLEALTQGVGCGSGGRRDDVEFTFRSGAAGTATTLGEATLRNRVKSHPDVGERWYPDMLAEIRAEQQAKAEAAAAAEEQTKAQAEASQQARNPDTVPPAPAEVPAH